MLCAWPSTRHAPNLPDRVITLSVSFGFYGKIPARGDFVRSGLPRGFIDGWDGWLQHMMAESRMLLAETWLSAWMVAPVWRFYLSAGLCGPGAACGVFMPSVDRAGRHFPLTLACVGGESGQPVAASLAWLGAAEAAGIEAVSEDLDPESLAGRVPPPDTEGAQWPRPAGACAWSTEGAPLVPARAFATETLPDAAVFARMLQAAPADPEARGP
jgi:type VI secretion system protein ImpM